MIDYEKKLPELVDELRTGHWLVYKLTKEVLHLRSVVEQLREQLKGDEEE